MPDMHIKERGEVFLAEVHLGNMRHMYPEGSPEVRQAIGELDEAWARLWWVENSEGEVFVLCLPFALMLLLLKLLEVLL